MDGATSPVHGPSAQPQFCAPSISGEPARSAGSGGAGLTKAKIAECQWLKPVLVGQFEFLEWTADDHLRHSRFVGLREDTDARSVTRE